MLWVGYFSNACNGGSYVSLTGSLNLRGYDRINKMQVQKEIVIHGKEGAEVAKS